MTPLTHPPKGTTYHYELSITLRRTYLKGIYSKVKEFHRFNLDNDTINQLMPKLLDTAKEYNATEIHPKKR